MYPLSAVDTADAVDIPPRSCHSVSGPESALISPINALPAELLCQIFCWLPLFDDEAALRTRRVFWVPTLATYWTVGRANGAWVSPVDIDPIPVRTLDQH